jgi:hypothetical protein
VEPIWKLLALKKGHWEANQNMGGKMNERVLFCQSALKMKTFEVFSSVEDSPLRGIDPSCCFIHDNLK